MTEILTTDYRSESTKDLIKRAEQMLRDPKLYPRTDDIIPYSRSGFGFMNQIYPYSPVRTLAPSCNRIEVKNVITVTDSSIVICGDATLGSCGGIPISCPAGVTPNEYVNMVATVDALVAQTGIKIAFDYLPNDTPTTTEVTVDLAAGSNTVYCFAENVQYTADTTLALHGARVV